MVNFNSVEDRLKLSNACNKLYWGSLLSLVPITIFGPRFSNLGVLLVEFVSLFGKYQFTKNLYKCDEYKRLNEVYDEILNNLVELANEFGLKNPLEILVFFRILISNGYLSYDRYCDIRMKKNLANEDIIMGSISLNNHGVCRHIGTMVDDFSHKMNYDAQKVLGHRFNPSIILEEDFIPMDFLFKLLRGEMDSEELDEFLKKLANKTDEQILLMLDNTDLQSNHLLNLINYEGNSYYIDATLDSFLLPYNDKEVLISNNGSYFRAQMSPLERRVWEIEPIKRLPSLSLDEQKNIYNKCFDILFDNLDMFEKFNASNKDILEYAEHLYSILSLVPYNNPEEQKRLKNK